MKLRELCELCGFEYDGKNTNKALERIRKEYVVEKNMLKRGDYVIVRPLTEEEKLTRKMLLKCKYYECFAEKYDENTIKKGGIYAIISNNDVYIGQTNKFNERLVFHYTSKYVNDKESKVYEMLHNDAKMTILEVEDDQEQRLTKEAKYVYEFIEKGYKVLNSTKVLYYGKNKQKKEYRNIKILECDYDKAIKILEENGVEIR